MHNDIEAFVERACQVLLGKAHHIRLAFACLLARGHLLIEDLPGVGKTTLAHTLARLLGLEYRRVQFTSGLLPADIVGVSVFDRRGAEFRLHRGPIFTQVVLADEINRAPAKVQSALLEAMAERQITVGNASYPLPPLFLVMATQNPIEQEGTYPLPEAQLDRFLLHVFIDYPELRYEQRILELARAEARGELGDESLETPDLLSQEDLFEARRQVLDIHMAPGVEEYLLQLVLATRNPSAYSERLAGWIEYGASPRASIGLDRSARAHAWLAGRDYVSPEDIQTMAFDVLRHRLILNYEAEAEGVTPDRFISELVALVPVP